MAGSMKDQRVARPARPDPKRVLNIDVQFGIRIGAIKFDDRVTAALDCGFDRVHSREKDLRMST
jgi:hypothetical protein